MQCEARSGTPYLCRRQSRGYGRSYYIDYECDQHRHVPDDDPRCFQSMQELYRSGVFRGLTSGAHAEHNDAREVIRWALWYEEGQVYEV